MIFNKNIDVKIANLCCIAATSGHVETFKNTGTGIVTQFVYVIDGGGNLTMNDTLIPSPKGSIVDLTPYKDQPVSGVALENGIIWIGINPKDNVWLEYKTFEPGSYSLNALDKDQYLVCLKGQINVGTAVIKETMFSKLPLNKDISFTLDANSFAIILSKDPIL